MKGPQAPRNGGIANKPLTTRSDEGWGRSLAGTNNGIARFGNARQDRYPLPATVLITPVSRQAACQGLLSSKRLHHPGLVTVH